MDAVYIGTTNYGRHWLDAPAAASWNRMVRDGCPPEGITDAGRTLQEQVDVFLKYFTTNYATSARFDQRYWNGQNYWRRPGQPSAATPGSVQARHTFGRALDLNGPTKAWVRANGSRYGWIKDLVRGEDWHMEYLPARDVEFASNPGGSTGNVPDVPDIEPIDPIPEDDMTPDQERMLREVHAALGAGGAIGTADILTVLGRLADVQANINGQPGVNVAVQTSLAALTKAVEELAGVVYKGTGGTAVDDTVYQRVKRLDES